MKFSELSEEAREHVVNNWELWDTWWDSEYECAKEEGLKLGFDIDDIYFSGFSSQGDGAMWIGSIDIVDWLVAHASENEKYIAICALVENGDSDKARIGVISTDHRYSHEYTMSFDEVSMYDENYVPEDVIESKSYPILNGILKNDLLKQISDEDMNDLNKAMQESARDYARKIYRALEKEYEYLTSEECIAEECEANDYEFDEDGRMV